MRMIRTGLAAVALFSLASCSGQTPQQTQALISAGVVAAITVADVAAGSNKNVADLVNKGLLFCQDAGPVVAVVNSVTQPTSVIGQGGAVVATACTALSPAAKPVVPPPNPGAAPIVIAPKPVIPSQAKV